MRVLLLFWLSLAGGSLFGVGFVQAQEAPVPADTAAWTARQAGRINLGIQAGRPGGASLKLYRSPTVAFDVLLTTDADDYFRLTAFRVWEHPIPGSPLHAFVGPGLLAGVGTLRDVPGPLVGVGGMAGLNFYAERFEVYLHVSPRIQLYPSRSQLVGGSVGLRYGL